MSPLMLLATAYAQVSSPDANGQLFRPSIDSTHTLWTTDSARAPNGYLLARGVVHYANRPVSFVDAQGETVPVVSDVLQLSVLAAYSRGPVRLGVDLPVYLFSAGLEGNETGLGDAAIDGKVTFLDRTRLPVGLALSGRVSFPTTTVNASLGNGGFGWELSAIADAEPGPILVAIELGTRGLPDRKLNNFTWSDQFQARLGLGWAPTDNGGLSLDVGSNINYANVTAGSTPAEAILGGWGRVADSLVIRGGVGTGITNGFGAPRFRAILGFGYEPPRSRDTDGDGIADRADACRNEPEDVDGHADEDGCPDPTPVTVHLVDPDGTEVTGRWTLDGPVAANGKSGEGAALPGGDYRLEAFGDGFVELSKAVTIPDAPSHELRVTVYDEVEPTYLKVVINDENGKPIPEATWGVVGDTVRRQPTNEKVEIQPGAFTIRATAPGYRMSEQPLEVEMGDTGQLVFSLAEARTVLTAEKIEIKDSIYFETAKAVIKPESFDLLDEVAEVLAAHAEITRIRIEGHTDSRGGESYNLDLSRSRAAAVKAYLIDKGIAPERLDSAGFGEGKPLVEGENEAAWAKNRRVDFFVVEREE